MIRRHHDVGDITRQIERLLAAASTH
jgi:hypothetical protein